MRALLMPIAKLWFRMKVTGAEYVPDEGAAIIAPNHKSLYDPFFDRPGDQAPRCTTCPRPSSSRAVRGRLLSDLGAFPVRRGTADPEALETARIHLEARPRARALPGGHARARPGGAARRRAAAPGGSRSRPQAPIVPCAITGTDRAVRAVPASRSRSRSPRRSARPARGHARGRRRADREPGLARGRARVPPPAHHPGVIAAIVATLGAGAAGGGIAYRRQRKPKSRVAQESSASCAAERARGGAM